MGSFVTAALKAAIAIWRRHYRVPEWTYWIVLVFALGAATAGIVTGAYADLFAGQAFGRQFVGGLVMAAVTVIVGATAIIGIVRWHRDRRKVKDGLVVALFHETAGAKERGKDVQLMVLDALQEHVPEQRRGNVHAIKATVGLGQRDVAARLLRRLGAHALLHGRVDDRADGGWSVHARLALPATQGLTHYDWHTNDTTKGRMPWRTLFSGLPSTRGVTDEEFPLELTRDLEALMKGSIGAVGAADSPAELESLLRAALAVKSDSASPAMDVLRTQLAFVIFYLNEDRQEEALELLRERIKAGDAFGELLRGFAFLAGEWRRHLHRELSEGLVDEELLSDEELDDDELDDDELDDHPDPDDLTPQQARALEHATKLLEESEKLEIRAYKLENQAEKIIERTLPGVGGSYESDMKRLRELDASLREEIIAALSTAAEDDNDPLGDMSLYNLINELLSAAAEADDREKGTGTELREEAWSKLDELRRRSSYYRRTWYVKRLVGLRAWLRFEDECARHRAHSPEGIAAAREAAKWYSRAIRARPRFGVRRLEDGPIWLRRSVRSRRSPILDGNAHDAHVYARHKLRAVYHEVRFRLRRRALLRGAFRDLTRGYVVLAWGQFDWILIGRHRPERGRYDTVEAVARAARDRAMELIREAPSQHSHADADADESEVDELAGAPV